MAAQATKMAREIKGIKQDAEELSEKTIDLISPEVRPEFAQKVERIKRTLSVEMEKGRAAAAAERPEDQSGLRDYLNKEINAVIKLGKVNGRTGFEQVIPDWRDLRVRCESMSRRLELSSAIGLFRSKDLASRVEGVYAQEPNIMYLAEKGDSSDVPALLQMKDLVPYRYGAEAPDVPALLDQAVEQIYKRMMASIEDLCGFYGVGEADFARLIGLADVPARPTVIPRVDRKLKTLTAIRDSLERQFPDFEIRRWLHTPNPQYKGQTPAQAVFKGGMVRVLEDLQRLEEGVPG